MLLLFCGLFFAKIFWFSLDKLFEYDERKKSGWLDGEAVSGACWLMFAFFVNGLIQFSGGLLQYQQRPPGSIHVWNWGRNPDKILERCWGWIVTIKLIMLFKNARILLLWLLFQLNETMCNVRVGQAEKIYRAGLIQFPQSSVISCWRGVTLSWFLWGGGEGAMC